MDVAGHRAEEIRIGNSLLVGTDMDVGCMLEDGGHLGEDVLQLLNALAGLHGVAHGALESLAVARHVDLGNDGDAAVVGQLLELATLFLRVVTASETRHRRGFGELRILLHLEAPRLVLGEVEVECVHLEAGQQGKLPLQGLKTDEGAPDVVHQTAQLECRPIGDGATLQCRLALTAFGQLGQCLHGMDDAQLADGLDGDACRGDIELISLVGITFEGIVVSPFDGAYQLDGDGHGRGLVADLLTHDQGKGGGDAFRLRRGEADLPVQCEGCVDTLDHLLGFRQQMCKLSLRCGGCSHEDCHDDEHFLHLHSVDSLNAGGGP